MKISNFFIGLDFMSETLSFENNGSKNFKSCFGAFISILVIIGSVIISSFFGKELVERKLPITSSYSNFIQTSKFDLKSFPLIFMISDTTGKSLSNYEDYFTVGGALLNRTNAVPDYYNPEEYVSKRCERQDLVNIEKIVGEQSILDIIKLPLICLNYNQDSIIKNDYAYLNSSYVNVNFRYCNPTIKKCASDSKNRANDFYIRTYFVNNYVNSFDYDDPVKFYLDSHLQQVNKGTLRRNFIRFTVNMFISDKGWLFEDIKESEYISFKSINVESNANPPNYPDDYYWITIASPQIRLITYRSYLKVQELAAKIGGIVNAINIVAYIVFANYLRYIYIFNVGRHIIDGEISLKSGKILNNFISNKSDNFSILKKHEKKILENEEEDPDKLRESHLSINRSNFRENNKSNISNLNESEINKLEKRKEKELENNNVVKINKLEKIINFKEPTKDSDLPKTLDYLSNTSYFEFVWELLKENLLFCCLSNNEYYSSLQNFLKVHLDFFGNIRKLTSLSVLTD